MNYILVNVNGEYLSSYSEQYGAFWTIHKHEALTIPKHKIEYYKQIFKYRKFIEK